MRKLTRRQFETEIRNHSTKYFGLSLTRHQVRWLKHIHFGGNRVMTLGPRRHGKTTAVIMIYMSWALANDPQLRFIFVSHKDKRAKSFSRRLREAMLNPLLVEDFGITKGSSWATDEWQIRDRGKKTKLDHPTVETVGAGGGISGASTDWVVVDDLLTITNCKYEQSRADIKEWVINEVFNTIDAGPKMRIIIIGTRKHKDDWYGELLVNPDYDCLVDRAIKEDGTPLWPKKYKIEELEARKRQDPVGFAHEYMNNPVDPEGDVFKAAWLDRPEVYYQELPDAGDLRYFMGVDVSAGSLRKRSTYFAYAVAAHHPLTDKIYLTELFRGKLTVGQQKKRIRQAYWKLHNAGNLVQCLIEAPLLYGELYGDVIRELPKAKKYSPKHDKLGDTRIPDKLMRIETILAPLFELGKFRLRNPNYDRYTKVYIQQEYIPFPHGDLDISDSIVYAVASISKKKRFTKMPFIWGKRTKHW